MRKREHDTEQRWTCGEHAVGGVGKCLVGSFRLMVNTFVDSGRRIDGDYVPAGIRGGQVPQTSLISTPRRRPTVPPIISGIGSFWLLWRILSEVAYVVSLRGGVVLAVPSLGPDGNPRTPADVHAKECP